MIYETISDIEGNLPAALTYEGKEQKGTIYLCIGSNTKPMDALTIQTASYFTKQEVLEFAMILMRMSNQMADFYS